MNFPNKVLLIDDDLEDYEILHTALKECSELVECCHEQTAQAALKRLFDATEPVPDMVFLDWRMPLMSGAEILSIIRNQPHFTDIPVVIFTGGYAQFWEEAQQSGASYFLNKPSRIEDLVIDLKHLFEKECKRRSA